MVCGECRHADTRPSVNMFGRTTKRFLTVSHGALSSAVRLFRSSRGRHLVVEILVQMRLDPSKRFVVTLQAAHHQSAFE
jgi:hypothetical protein